MDGPDGQSSDSAVLLVSTVDDGASSGASSCDNDDSTKDERGNDHTRSSGEKAVRRGVLAMVLQSVLRHVVCLL
jgi:hypothetical protein